MHVAAMLSAEGFSAGFVHEYRKGFPRRRRRAAAVRSTDREHLGRSIRRSALRCRCAARTRRDGGTARSNVTTMHGFTHVRRPAFQDDRIDVVIGHADRWKSQGT